MGHFKYAILAYYYNIHIYSFKLNIYILHLPTHDNVVLIILLYVWIYLSFIHVWFIKSSQS